MVSFFRMKSGMPRITNGTGIVKLSHLSVKEYLLSQHRVGATGFSISEKLSHSHIAKTCLAYLLQFNIVVVLTPDIINKYPLAKYAAKHWIMHVHAGGEESTDVQQQKLITTLFQPRHTVPFISWVNMHNIDDPRSDIENISACIPSVFYYASSAGLLLMVQALVKNGVDVNVQEGRFGNALQAASLEGHEAIVGFLVEKGADVNVQGGEYGNALQAASYRGHNVIVDLLLEKGADVNAQGGEYGNALQAASYEGHKAIVDLLLEKGADVNAQG